MSSLLCLLWPYLAGGLIGWLLAGWFARKLKYVTTVEKTIERKVNIDNPEHLKRISLLEEENTQITSLRSQIESLEGNKTENAGNAEYLKRINSLEDENKKFISQIETFKNQKTKITDNPEHLKHIAALEEENTHYKAQLLKIKQGEEINLKAAKLTALASTHQEIETINRDAAKAAGFKVKGSNDQHDFTVVEGIGPKINGLIHEAGIHLYSELAKTEVSGIQKILDDAGPRYKLARPNTWPAQSKMAAENEWEALGKWQDELDGGKE